MRTKHIYRNRRGLVLAATFMLAGGAMLAFLGGCQQPQPQPGEARMNRDPLGPFDVLGLMRKPIRVGETNLEFTPPPLILPKRELFRGAMAETLKEPVQFELMTPRQIRVHLGTGRTSFAMVKPHELPEVMSTQTCDIMGVSINNAGKTYRQGLIITGPKSPIKTLADVKGARFHFMPAGDLLNDAAMGALIDAGIDKKEIDKSIFGLGLDTYHISSLEVAKSVVLEGRAAGVIDEADYEKWPDEGGSLVLLTASKEQVRVIGKTMRVPEWAFLVSRNVDPEIKKTTHDFLFKIAPTKYKLAMAAMDLKGFAPPIDPKEYEPFSRLYNKLHPKPPGPATEPAEPESQPVESN